MSRRTPGLWPSGLYLREVDADDLPIFFDHQLDPDASHMAAFTARNPADLEAFMRHWARILGDETITIKAILLDGQVAGHILVYEQDGRREVSYWLGKRYWGQGLATRALAAFLDQVGVRPLYARAAKDNVASIRVLEKCGFTTIGEDRGFANARGAEVEELILELRASDGGALRIGQLAGDQFGDIRQAEGVVQPGRGGLDLTATQQHVSRHECRCLLCGLPQARDEWVCTQDR